jgi:hypothetical protein
VFFPTFQIEHVCTNRYISDKSPLEVLPIGCHELTQQEYDEVENKPPPASNKRSKAVHMEKGETFYVSALGWQRHYANSYPKGFPYSGLDIKNAYFRGINTCA